MFSRGPTRARLTPRCKTSDRTNSVVSSSPSYQARHTSSGFKRRQRSVSVLRQSGSRRCRFWRRRSHLRRWYRPKSVEVVRQSKSDSGRITSASKTAQLHRTPWLLPKMTARTLLDWKCPVGEMYRPTASGHPIR